MTKQLSRAINQGFEDAFVSTKLTDKQKEEIQEAFLEGFTKELKDIVAKDMKPDFENLQKGTILPRQGNLIHAGGVGDLHVQELSKKNWLRILFRKPIRDVNITVSTQKLNFQEDTVH
jgi:hypothetical protein